MPSPTPTTSPSLAHFRVDGLAIYAPITSLSADLLGVLHHDVGDSGRGEGGWGLVSDGGVGSVVVVVNQPALEVVGALGF